MDLIDYSKLNILVIEDEKFSRELTCALLRSLGVSSLAICEDGEAGFVELLRTRPDIVFCDVRMAGMDGRQFLRQVRAIKHDGLERTPVVFLTGDMALDTAMFAHEHGINGYLVKPVSRSQIQARVDTIIAADRVLQTRLSVP